MMGLVAPINGEENKKKRNKKAPRLMTGREAPPPSCTQKHKKRTKKGELKLPTPPSPSIMAGNKASLPNYAHKNKKSQKRGVESSPFIQEVYEGMV
jgi:hypothetical protein